MFICVHDHAQLLLGTTRYVPANICKSRNIPLQTVIETAVYPYMDGDCDVLLSQNLNISSGIVFQTSMALMPLQWIIQQFV